MTLMTKLLDTEPSCYEQAASQQVWQDAMVEEYSSILKNNVLEIVPWPKGKSVVGSCWVYKVKHGADGSVEKYKAKFVTKGFSQVEGIDYDETFSPVARHSSIKTILALAAQMGQKIHRMDMKTTFLNGVVEEDIHMEQLQGLRLSAETFMSIH